MTQKTVSVVIPSFDRYEFLLNAIESINNQTYKIDEIIIVNDGSTQQEYYKNNFQENVNLIHIDRSNTPNWGGSRPAVRNYGIELSNCDYVAFLDDDDYWLPQKTEMQITQMEKLNVGFSCTEGYFGYGIYQPSKSYPLYNKEQHFKKIKKKFRRTKHLRLNKFPNLWTYDFLRHHNCVVLSSVIVETDLIKQLGGFRGLYRSEYFQQTSDHDCWLGLLQLTNLAYVDEPLFYYDAGHGSGKKYIN